MIHGLTYTTNNTPRCIPNKRVSSPPLPLSSSRGTFPRNGIPPPLSNMATVSTKEERSICNHVWNGSWEVLRQRGFNFKRVMKTFLVKGGRLGNRHLVHRSMRIDKFLLNIEWIKSKSFLSILYCINREKKNSSLSSRF